MAESDPRFINDYFSDGIIIIKIIRSTVPRAKISGISIPELSGDAGVFMYEDLPAEKNFRVFDRELPLLSDGHINYKGQPILLLYGSDQLQLEEIEKEIRIEYNTAYPILSMENYNEDQIVSSLNFEKGKKNTEELESHKIVEDEFFTDAQLHYDFDPQGAVAFKRKKNKFEIICTTLWPFNVKENISTCTGLSSSDFEVSVPVMSKTHSSKLWHTGFLACYTALISKKTGKDSICLLSRRESVLFTPRRAASSFRFKSGLDKNGKLLFREIEIKVDAGAYPVLDKELLNRISFSAAGLYSCPNIKIKTEIIKTSSPPTGSYNGLGFHQSFFAGEMHTSNLSAASELFPSEWKLLNSASKFPELPLGWENKKNLTIKQLLKHVIEKSDFNRKSASYRLVSDSSNIFSGPKRGIGIATACQGNGFMGRAEESGKYSVSTRLDTDGKLIIMTSAVPENRRTSEIWKETAGKILEIEDGDIRLEFPDTGTVPDSGPGMFSRSITIINQLIENCCKSIKKSRFRLPLPIEVKRSFRRTKKDTWDAENFSGTPFGLLSWGAAVVETETDPISLETGIRGVWIAVDCGRILDKKLAEAEIESEIYRCLSNTAGTSALQLLNEKNIALSPVQPKSKLPIDITFIEGKETKSGGLGELPDNLIPAAFSQAVAGAMNIGISRFPTDSEQLFDRIIEENSEQDDVDED